MAAQANSVLLEEDSFDLTSMIDVVFLLLIYFMYLPIQQEADLLFSLPADTAPVEGVALPSEQIVEIAPDGSIFLNGALIEDLGERLFPPANSGKKEVVFKELTSTLARLKASADRAKVSTVVSIYADGDSPHQASISVLNSCAQAGIKQVSFGEAR